MLNEYTSFRKVFVMVSPQIKDDMVPAISFALPFLFAPIIVFSSLYGGYTILIAPIFGYVFITICDFLIKISLRNPDPNRKKNLVYHKAVLWVWPLIQFFLIFWCIYVISNHQHLSLVESVFLMMAQGMITGAVGITFAHELMHQKSSKEKWLADILMGMALYGHFRTEHLLVHHRYVGTDKDAVTAKYDESFFSFFLRVLPSCFKSAWDEEVSRLRKINLPGSSLRNPFWRYGILAAIFLMLSFAIGGSFGVLLFFTQAFIAILHLEMANYIEHYGLTRKLMSNGKYEPTKPHHSWNANHTASNLLLINLQLHSDHHAKPDREYPLLQKYDKDQAPQLPFGYPLMIAICLIPVLWRKVMNPRVDKWREHFYPEFK